MTKNKDEVPKQPTTKELADAIRKFPDIELIQLYNLAINQLETVALSFKGRILEGLKKK